MFLIYTYEFDGSLYTKTTPSSSKQVLDDLLRGWVSPGLLRGAIPWAPLGTHLNESRSVIDCKPLEAQFFMKFH